MSAQRGFVRPVVVEVKPDRAPSVSLSSPSSSPRVHFASTSTNGVSRPLTSVEAWSLYHFERHSRSCHTCYDPMENHRRGQRLCHEGHALAQDVALLVQYRDGEYYEKADGPSSSFVRVEVPHNYTKLNSLLKALDRGVRTSRHHHAPVVSYDRSYPVVARPVRRATSPYSDYEDDDRAEVIIEPARSKSHRSSKHRSHYSAKEIIDDVHDLPPVKVIEHGSRSKERRGTLYEKDMQRKKEHYRVEVHRPRTAYWL